MGDLVDYKLKNKAFISVKPMALKTWQSSQVALYVVSLAFLLLGIVSTTKAQSEALEMECAEGFDEETPILTCDFRLSEPNQLEQLTLSANGTVRDDAVFTPYLNTGSTSAWLLFIDRTNPARGATVKRNVDIARDLLRNASQSRLIGVATFAGSLEVVVPIAATHDRANEKLSAISADGVATEYFASALEAIKLLAETDADRKAVIVMSDGKAEDTAYTLTDVASAANAAGVTIVGMGFAEGPTETPHLQKIQRLTEETAGSYVEVIGNNEVSSEFLNNLFRYVENGGVIRAPSEGLTSPVTITLDAQIADVGTLSASQVVELTENRQQGTEEVLPEPLPLIGQIYSVAGRGVGNWAVGNQAIAWLLLIILPALAIAGTVFANRFSNATVPDGPHQTDVIEPIEPIEPMIDDEDDGATRHFSTAAAGEFGYFEVVGNEEKRYTISAHSLSIGRHSDNNIQLSNDSVHRHHAHLHIANSGTVTINDLGTQNGVIVNEKRVDKQELTSGDVIELGEVRLRYLAD